MATRRSIPVYLLFAALFITPLTRSAHADPIQWRNNFDAAMIEAGRTDKLVLLHFYTSSCVPCKKLERDVFSQPQIAAAIERDYVPVKLNAQESPAFANRYQISRVPSEVVLNSQGTVLQKLSCPLTPDAYGSQIVNVAQHYRQRSQVRTASAQAPINSAYAGLKIGPPPKPQAARAVPPSNSAPTTPATTQNPYLSATPPAAAQPVTTQTATPAQTSAPAVAPQVINNIYGQRYAQVAPKIEVNTKPVVAPKTVVPVAKSEEPQRREESNAATAAIKSTPASRAESPALEVPSEVSEKSVAQATIPPKPAASATPTVSPAAQNQIATAQQVVEEVWPPELPAGAPPLGFEGYCPVSLQQAKKWVRGDKTYGAIHRGRTYLFANDLLRKKFLASPDSYSPVFSGNDPVLALDENKQVAGQRKFGFEYRNAFYLFSSKETMTRFASRPDHYSAGVRQAMNRLDAVNGTIRR